MRLRLLDRPIRYGGKPAERVICGDDGELALGRRSRAPAPTSGVGDC